MGSSGTFYLRPLILDVEAHFRERCGDDHTGAAEIERAIADTVRKELSLWASTS